MTLYVLYVTMAPRLAFEPKRRLPDGRMTCNYELAYDDKADALSALELHQRECEYVQFVQMVEEHSS